MKFKYVGPNGVDSEGLEIPANIYMGLNALTGEIVELDDHFSKKAMNNANYERVKPGPKKIKPKQEKQLELTE
jgi:hypothetical protein